MCAATTQVKLLYGSAVLAQARKWPVSKELGEKLTNMTDVSLQHGRKVSFHIPWGHYPPTQNIILSHVGGVFSCCLQHTICYLLFYFICGLVADFAHILSLTTPMELAIPTLGASGAISGVMGAYIIKYPRARIRTLVLAYFITVVSVPAVLFLGFWFVLQLLYTWVDIGGGVAYWAHIGGFVVGMVLALIIRGRKKRIKPAINYYGEPTF